MEFSPIFFLEFGVFNGAALAWGFYELWSVRRSQREDERKKTPESEQGPRHPER